MERIKSFTLPIFMALLLAGCQVTIPPAGNTKVNNSTNATTLTILDAKNKRIRKSHVHAPPYILMVATLLQNNSIKVF